MISKKQQRWWQQQQQQLKQKISSNKEAHNNTKVKLLTPQGRVITIERGINGLIRDLHETQHNKQTNI